MRTNLLFASLLFGMMVRGSIAADWPQWRGINRDAKVTGFTVPATWPKELTKKWSVKAGDGVSTPALVGDKLYVFTREGDSEILRCLEAASGKELWQDKYEAQPATGAAGSFPGPRSSPTVADGKIVTLGVRGTLSCLDAASGKVLWRKSDVSAVPKFFTSCSPLIVDGLLIVQLGGEGNGGIMALELASGNDVWKWTGDGTAYASPVLLAIDGIKAIVAETATKIVAVNAANGKLLWETPFAVSGRGYNAATPVVAGQSIVFSGSSRGTHAVKIDKQADGLGAKELWTSPDSSVMFNTPVVKGDQVFGISADDKLFCLSAKDGKTAWTTSLEGRGRLRGYGSVVDAGSVLLALNPAAQLAVFQPTDKEYKQLASYKVSDNETFAYPVLSGNLIYIKDKDAVTLWTVD
jgi:outer membrane protein assembly factor BamB